MSDSFADLDPEIASIIADVADDYRARLKRGESPDPESYAARYPAAADEIRGVLSVLQLACSSESSRGLSPTVDAAGPRADTPPPSDSTSAIAADALPRPGDSLGHFQILAELGHGGMGAVFRALDTKLHREVAVKVILPAVAARAGMRERFLREARALAALHHDHVVPVFHVDEDCNIPFFVMPLLAGESLQSRLARDGSLAPPEVIRIGRETALGLAALHAKGMLHRDIKPANLWLEAPNGRVKLLDFGLARDSDEGNRVTVPGAIVGTPAYMSPEQVNGEPVDSRTDLFSLGSVLYEASTGRPPFAGNSMTAILAAVGEKDPRPARELNPAIPPELSDLLWRLHRKRAADRPASATEVADALGRLQQRPIPVRRLYGKQRILLFACLAAILVAAAGILVWRATRPASPSPNADEPRGVKPSQPPVVLEPLRVRELNIVHWATVGRESVRAGILGKQSFGVVLGDAIEVDGRLTRPAFTYVIVFGTDGKDQLLFPQDDVDVPEATDEPRFPSKRRGVRYYPDEGTGLSVVALVASDQRLPSYRDWRAAHPGGPWKKSAGTRDAVWLDDGKWLEQLRPGQQPTRGSRGVKEAADKAPIVGVVDWLKAEVKGSTVSAVGFTVVGK